MILGIMISFTSFIISFYTCKLIIITAKKDKDYVFTLKKYFGKPGYYIGLIGPAVLVFGAICVYFVVIVQSAYPLWYVFLNNVCGLKMEFVDPNKTPYCRFDKFSASWIALLEFVKLLSLSLRKDLEIFMRLGFLGATCVISMITFVIIYGIIGITNTDYETRLDPTESDNDGLLW